MVGVLLPLLLLLLVWPPASVRQSTQDVLRPCSLDSPSVADLRAAYAIYNAKYFSGKLPGDAKVDYGPAGGYMGYTMRCGPAWCIEINPDFNRAEKTAYATLLHEMVHVEIADADLWHGKVFKAELHRLMDAGAFDDLL